MLSNADLRRLSELKDRAGRKRQGLFFIEGRRAILEALTGRASIEHLFLRADTNPGKLSDVLSIAEKSGITVEELPSAKFRKLTSTENSQGIIAVAAANELGSDKMLADLRPKRNAIVLLLDRISDPGNLGTILRSAVWFGVDGVFVSTGSVDAYNPKVVRSAMSAICGLSLVQDAVIIDEVKALKSLGFDTIASTQETGSSYVEYDYPRRSAVVFGSEATGISKDVMRLCSAQVRIPRIGKMESLNVGVAASIVLSEMVRRKSANRYNS